MAKYKEYKDQFVVVHIVDFDQALPAISHALFLAQMIRKGIILLHVSDPDYTTLTPADAEPRLKLLQQQLQSGAVLNTPYPLTSYMALKGKTKEIVNALPLLVNAVAAVVTVSPDAPRRSLLHPKTLLRCYLECRVAYLAAQKPLLSFGQLSHVALTVDYQKESKEKMTWASYFARFNQSQIHVLHYDYADEGLRYKWKSNMQFMQRFFNAFGASFSSHVIPGRKAHSDIEALHYAHQQQYGLLLAATTPHPDVSEWFSGTQEQSTIVNSYQIPILFVNPREDVYVLCD